MSRQASKRYRRQRPQRRRRATGQRNRCPSGKVRFRDALEAQMALARARTSDSPRRRECRHYSCEICHGYHLTSQPKEK